MFDAYLEGKGFKIENLLKHDELACRKFNIWKANKGKLQTSFSKSSMSASDSYAGLQVQRMHSSKQMVPTFE